jgi:hypothetical protein
MANKRLDETTLKVGAVGDSDGLGGIDMNNQKLPNLATPTLLTDAATKGYVDNNSGTGDVTGPSSSSDNQAMVADGTTGKVLKTAPPIFQTDGRITSVADPTGAQNVATKNYVDSNFAASASTLTTNTILIGNGAKSLKASSLTIDSESRINNVGLPTSSNDAANKQYVDNNSGGSGFEVVADMNSVPEQTNTISVPGTFTIAFSDVDPTNAYLTVVGVAPYTSFQLLQLGTWRFTCYCSIGRNGNTANTTGAMGFSNNDGYLIRWPVFLGGDVDSSFQQPHEHSFVLTNTDLGQVYGYDLYQASANISQPFSIRDYTDQFSTIPSFRLVVEYKAT